LCIKYRRVRGFKLVIHSAYYGTGPENDQDVIEAIKQLPVDGLVIPVDNNALQCDPAPNRPGKRLRVKYSYGNDKVYEVSMFENSRMVLPEKYEQNK
jgi:hypothetical protein